MIKVYGTPTCSYCKKAKELIESYGRPYEYFSIGEDVAISEVKTYVPEGWRTVPIVTLNDKFVGGYEQLAELLENECSSYGH